MREQKEKKTPEEVAASPVLNQTSTVVKHFLPDYVRGLQDPLWEVEENGLTYRYGYGLARLSVTIDGITNGAGNLIGPDGKVKLYYHQDYLGTVDYLTSDLTGKITSWTKYNEWGEITHNAVLKCGQRQLDLVKNYTGHDYDQVIGLYYAKNRMYDPENRRFTQIDPIKDGDNWYAYVGNNPVNRWDPLGLFKAGDQLRLGSNNNPEDVILLQNALTAKTKYSLVPDGSFGPQTLAAVNAFKDSTAPGGNTLESGFRGVVGIQTWTALGIFPEYTYERELLSETSKNDKNLVMVLQTQLKNLGKYDGAIDGNFSNQLTSAVNAFKTEKGLGNTGIYAGVVGPQTWDYLGLNQGYNKAFFCLPSTNTLKFAYPLPQGSYRISAGWPKYPSGGDHRGIDLATYGVEGKEVYATAAGKVVRVVSSYSNSFNIYKEPDSEWKRKNSYGNRVDILLDDGYTIRYAHLQNNIIVKVGDIVIAGQQIASSGNTGSSSGPHLHYEVLDPKGNVADPRKFLPDNI